MGYGKMWSFALWRHKGPHIVLSQLMLSFLFFYGSRFNVLFNIARSALYDSICGPTARSLSTLFSQLQICQYHLLVIQISLESHTQAVADNKLRATNNAAICFSMFPEN